MILAPDGCAQYQLHIPMLVVSKSWWIHLTRGERSMFWRRISLVHLAIFFGILALCFRLERAVVNLVSCCTAFAS